MRAWMVRVGTRPGKVCNAFGISDDRDDADQGTRCYMRTELGRKVECR